MKNILILLLLTLYNFSLIAQCSMCKANAESSLAQGDATAKGLNKGITYLLAVPYLAVLIIGLAFYLNYQRHNNDESASAS